MQKVILIGALLGVWKQQQSIHNSHIKRVIHMEHCHLAQHFPQAGKSMLTIIRPIVKLSIPSIEEA